MKLIEYAIWLVLAGIIAAVIMDLEIVKATLTAETVNFGDFQIGIFIFLVLMITVGFVMSRR